MFAFPIGYLLLGVATFFVIRVVFKKARLDPKPHDRIWSIDILVVLWWPVCVVASVFWLAADLWHAQGKKELRKAAELEARRDKRCDGFDLFQKIDLLKSKVDKANRRESNLSADATRSANSP